MPTIELNKTDPKFDTLMDAFYHGTTTECGNIITDVTMSSPDDGETIVGEFELLAVPEHQPD